MTLMRHAESATPGPGAKWGNGGLGISCHISVKARNHHVATVEVAPHGAGGKLKRGGTRRQQSTGLAATSNSWRVRLRQVDLSLSVPSVAQHNELLGGGRPEVSRPQVPVEAIGPRRPAHRGDYDATRSRSLRPSKGSDLGKHTRARRPANETRPPN